MENEMILSLDGIVKIYPGVVALDNVSVAFRRGEIHALVGENGAGKSTLIKVITGAVTPESGVITVNGERFGALTPAVAHAHGIEAIYQEFNLVDVLSAAENICFGEKHGRFVNQKAMREIAAAIFSRFRVDIDPGALVRNLSSAKRQIVEIAKAVSRNARLLIMDEPTAPLTNAETDILMDVVAQLKADGVTIIYISHRLDEIFRIADRVTVFRDGKYITTKKVRETTRPELIRYMVGRELSENFPSRRTQRGAAALELRNLTGNGVRNISFKAYRGEVLGVAGLVGAGRSEIMKVIIGAEARQWGKVLIDGREVSIKSPIDALRYGIGLVPEDRKREGCFLFNGVRWNIVFAALRGISKGLFVSRKDENDVAGRYIAKLKIKTPGPEQKVLNLSGGNQQKVVIAKTLAANTEIIIFDEPTRGIDVGAKHEIYELINALCAEGKAVVMVTSDMEELLGMSDRIVVLHEKRFMGEIPRELICQENVLKMASGVLCGPGETGPAGA